MGEALAAVIPALLVAALLLNIRKPTNIGLDVAGDRLVVELRRWDAFYCCRRRIDLAVQDVEGVGVYDRQAIPAEGLRLPGTSVPGVIRAGTYGTGSARDFWDVRRGRQLLVIQMKPDADYRRLVLEVPEPHEQMLRLRPVLGPLDWSPSPV